MSLNKLNNLLVRPAFSLIKYVLDTSITVASSGSGGAAFIAKVHSLGDGISYNQATGVFTLPKKGIYLVRAKYACNDSIYMWVKKNADSFKYGEMQDGKKVGHLATLVDFDEGDTGVVMQMSTGSGGANYSEDVSWLSVRMVTPLA